MVENDTDGAKTGLRRRDFWVNSLQVDNDILSDSIVSSSISGANINVSNISGTTSVLGTAKINDAYRLVQNGKGDYINHLKAEAIISGGMWVMGSAAVATPTNIVLKPAAASALAFPLGICVNTCQSGAVALVYARGVYNGTTNIIAEGTINAGTPFSVGAGGKLNTAIAWTAGSIPRGTAIVGAGSEGVLTLNLW
jgi:hypothetical protein